MFRLHVLVDASVCVHVRAEGTQGVVARTWFSLGFLRAVYIDHLHDAVTTVFAERMKRDAVSWQVR